MSLKEIVQSIPEEIHNDILEICSTTFLKGTTIYDESILPEKITKKQEIWEFIRNLDKTEYTIFEIQTYIALEKILKIDKKSIIELIGELYEEWEENEEFNNRRFNIIHKINKFYPNEFNEQAILKVLQNFLASIDKKDDISIAQSFINNAFPELRVIVTEDWKIININRRTVNSEFLEYIGFNILQELSNVNYRDYEIILKNKTFSKDKKIKSDILQNIVIDIFDFSKDDYLLEILSDSGFIDRINCIYNKLIEMFNYISTNLESDCYLYLEQI